ncbi:MAG: hypothetical protein A2Y73_03770 [Chloroflexi bacterium RBG_13_56_8]|nr:MAG: hypothetical protein A2Y73_03770 [Chloroflexi bacterium RBG_13_56_8]
MRDDSPLTTGEVGRYCGVSHATVWKWIKKGKLRAYRLSGGGHYRIERGAFQAFLRERNMPIDPAFFARPIKRVLITDDEPTVLDLVSRAMQRLGEGVQYATATDGVEAGLQLAAFKPDLLLLDLMMPRLDGFEVCRLARRNPATAHIKILVITGYGTHQNIERALSAGANDFLHKPLDIEELGRKAQSLLADEV